MKLVAALLALLMIYTPVEAKDWSKVSEKTAQSLVALSDARGNFCSGFVIDSKRDYILTANHCVDGQEEILVDGKTSVVIHQDFKEDLAVLQSETSKPALRPSARPIKRGSEVLSLGYAYGADTYQSRTSHVAYASVQVPEWCESSCVGVDNDHIGGMSGGPVVDSDGKLVSNVQFGDNKTGFGRSIGVILGSVGKFFAK